MLFENRTQVSLLPFGHRLQQHAARDPEKLPPKLSRLLKPIGTKRLNLKARLLERRSCSSHRRTRLGRDRSMSVILEISDTKFLQIVAVPPAHGHWSGRRIAVVRSLHHLEQDF